MPTININKFGGIQSDAAPDALAPGQATISYNLRLGQAGADGAIPLLPALGSMRALPASAAYGGAPTNCYSVYLLTPTASDLGTDIGKFVAAVEHGAAGEAEVCGILPYDERQFPAGQRAENQQ